MLVPVKGERVAKEYLEIADLDSETVRRFLREKEHFRIHTWGWEKIQDPALPWVRLHPDPDPPPYFTNCFFYGVLSYIGGRSGRVLLFDLGPHLPPPLPPASKAGMYCSCHTESRKTKR